MGFWERLDTLLHVLGVPLRWVCDRYDLALGMTADELRRTNA